ncbi:MAG: leucine-rich repeat protein, partial [Clostridia bacterium]
MNRLRKIIAVLVCAVMMCGILPAVNVGAANLWSYNVDTGTITKYNGNETDVVVPSEINGDKITKLSSYVFKGNENITRVTVQEGIKTIGDAAFYGCHNLREVYLPNTLEEIGSYEFLGCYSLNEVIIPDNVKVLGSYLFSNCTSLKKIVVGSGITELPGYFAFGCSSLVDVDIRGKINSVSEGAFLKCTSLKKLPVLESECSFPSGRISIDGYSSSVSSAFSYTAVENMVVPYGWKLDRENGGHMFSGCENLTSVTYYAEEVCDGMFSCCSNLRTVTLTSSVTVIYDYVFSNCTSLEKIHIPAEVTKIGSLAFSNCPNLTIYAPKNSEAYKYAMANNINWVDWDGNTDSSVTDEPIVVVITDPVSNDGNNAQKFSDVPSDSSYSEAVNYLVEKGIFNGYF